MSDTKEKNADILSEATSRFEDVVERDRDNREAAKGNIHFVYTPGRQWSDETRTKRTRWKEPCLEFNQLKQFVNQVVNEQRQGRPSIRVHPGDGSASKETAELLQGMIRGIEYQSKAEAAYDNAFGQAVITGRGAWRIVSEFESPLAFEQRLVIKPIADILSVYADLDYSEPDGSDRKYVFVCEQVPEEEFKRMWPDADPVSFDTIQPAWRAEKGLVMVADYYRRVAIPRTLVMMSDGAIGWKDEMPPPPEGVTIVAERESEDYKIEWFKIAGGEQVLERHEWPGRCIPVIITTGDDIIVEGKRVYQGLIDNAKDAQAMFNYGMTQQAVHLALTPRAPWVAPAAAIEGYENVWKEANTANFSVLPYNHVDESGNGIPPPTRQLPAMPDSGWINWCNTMTGLIKSTIGMYENSLSQRGVETSGRAIIAKQKQGDNATYHFVDNLGRAIALTGRIILDAIPTFYDTRRIVNVIQEDGTQKQVVVNNPLPGIEGAAQAIMENNVTEGKYSVTVDAGPGYATKRAEKADSLLSLVQSFPQLAGVAGDLVVRALDIPDADQIADRLKMALPPQIQEAEAANEDGKPPVDPAIVAALNQMKQQLGQAAGTAQRLAQENEQLKSGMALKVAEVEVKKAEVAISQNELAVEQFRAETERFKVERESEAAAIKARADAERAVADRIKAQAEIMRANLEAQTAAEEREGLPDVDTIAEALAVGAREMTITGPSGNQYIVSMPG